MRLQELHHALVRAFAPRPLCLVPPNGAAGSGDEGRGRLTKAPIDLESHFRWHGDAFIDGQVIDTLTPKIGANTDNDPLKRAEPVWDPDAHPTSWRAVWAYSAKRAVRDNKTLTAQENRARAVVAGEKAARKPRFVKTANERPHARRDRAGAGQTLTGLKGYVTNIDANVMPAAEVIASYHDLWHVEQSFRMSKSDLAARPMFARTRDAIEAHLTIVFTALAVSRAAQDRTGLSLRRVLRTLRPLRSATDRDQRRDPDHPASPRTRRNRDPQRPGPSPAHDHLCVQGVVVV